jgi:hypothetical protein
MIKIEVDPSQLLETDLVAGDDPLTSDRYLIYLFCIKSLG